ncbi:MAG TPA: AAA family ATPase [Pseudonocardiaceae bacterium]
MPLLGPADPLPHRPRRIAVSGTSGAGKSALARTVAAVTGSPYQELDALYHGPGWTPRDSFVADVEAFTSAGAWVTEWQFAQTRPLIAERADLLVWLDHPRPLVMTRVLRRTIRRRVRRTPLWNGNVEGSLWQAFTDRDDVLWWAWRSHRSRGERALALLDGPAASRLVVVRLRGQRQVDAWLAGPLTAAVG